MRVINCTLMRNVAYAASWLAFCAAALVSNAAFAQLTGDIGTSYDELILAAQQPGDHSRNILQDLLSDFGQNPFTAVGRPDTLLGNLFFLFNSGIFIVGTALLSYFILSSVAQTAHEGEVLGKRINGLWVPIRVSLGVFGMLPVFGGFSLAQAIVMWFVILGIGLANIMTKAAISDTEMFNALIPPPGATQQSDGAHFSSDTARQLFLMNVCVDTANAYYQETKGGDWYSWLRSEPELSFNNVGGNTAIRSVGISGDYSCGEVVLRRNEPRQGSFTGGWRSPAVNYDDIAQISNVAYEQKAAELLSMNTKMAALASQFVDAYYANDGATSVSLPASEFEAAAQEANQAVSSAVNQAIQGAEGSQQAQRSALTETASNEIKKGGWMSLGSWHSTYAEVQAALQTAAYNGQLTTVPVSDFSDASEDMYATIKRMMASANYVVQKPAEEVDYNFGQDVIHFFVNSATGNTAGTGMVNPVTAAKNAGDWMINIGLGMYAIDVLLDSIGGKVAMKVGEIASSAIALTGPLGGAVKIFAELAKDFASILPILGGLLIIVGGMLSIYVPMIPFLTWVAALVSYFVSVIEGLVAAQVWAFGHLSLDGEGMGQKTEKGYQYLLSALLRPPLMVLGFFFASAMLILIGSFVIKEMATVIMNVQGNSITGLISILGYFILFAILLITIVSTVFDIIFQIPDRVIAWFSSGLEAQMAKNMDAKIENQAKAAMGWAGGAGAVIQGARGNRKNTDRMVQSNQQSKGPSQ
ncbi:hypothetical protein PuT2_11420 [Pusillimonas sp. T2]|uniref:DotA/TraY family protein n=1 Tax=Pusillimonas sp. T2 TaxID=1548123 RepID=UPI000B9CEA04|nr:DotA/TraY family protein [Pusillimonas sp. T2]OXR48576.1 hypothetical protein PuT2_11420 [Pusillimonas sp. T2]